MSALLPPGARTAPLAALPRPDEEQKSEATGTGTVNHGEALGWQGATKRTADAPPGECRRGPVRGPPHWQGGTQDW